MKVFTVKVHNSTFAEFVYHFGEFSIPSSFSVQKQFQLRKIFSETVTVTDVYQFLRRI
jgi:hypothetical protein